MTAPASPFRHGYFGRVTGVGLTGSGRPAIWYAVTGRGKFSRQRRATAVSPEPGVTEVQIEALEQRTFGAPATAVLRLRADPPLAIACSPTGVVELATALASGKPPRSVLADRLASWGPEGPPYRSPRTAALLLPSERAAWVGVTTEAGQASVEALPLTSTLFTCLPTHSGATGSTDPVSDELPSELVTVALAETDAQRLAATAYELFDPELIICAAVAVWRLDRAWELGLANLRPD